MCEDMHAQYPFDPPAGTFPQRYESHANMVNNTVSVYTGPNKLELLTDEQTLAEILEERLLALAVYTL